MIWNWKIVWMLVKSTLMGTLVGIIVLGALGFLLAGQVGMENLAVWGAVFGLVGGALSSATIMYARYSEEIGRDYSHWRAEEEAKKAKP